MAIALNLVAVGGLSFWFRGTAGADDAFIASPDAPWRPAPNGLPLSADEMASALAAGDVVVAVNGRSMERWAVDLLDPALTRPAPPSGTRFRYTVERNHEQLEVAVELHPTPLLARLAGQWSTILLVVLLFVVAGIIFVARPDGPPTRAMLLVAALMACAAPSWILNLQVSDLVWGAGFWWWMTGQIATAFLYAALLHFALVLPARLPSNRSRPLLVTLAYLGPIVLHAAYLAMTLPGASGVLERVRLVGSCYVLTQLVYPVLVTVTLVIGFRATQDTVVRRQLRWLALTIAVGSLLHLVLFDLWDRAFGHALLPWSLHTLVFLPCPVAAAVAAIRYQAFQVHLVINRSLVWTSLTACIAAAYGTVLTLLATILHGQVRPRLALTLAATGAIAVGLQPLQRRLQRTLNRLMYGDRDDPYRVLARLGQQLESTVSPDVMLANIAHTVAEALKLPYAGLELRRDGHYELAASSGTLVGQPTLIQLAHRGETVGRLVLGCRPPSERLTPADRRVLEALAPQAGVAVHAAELAADLERSRAVLQRSGERLEQARARLVTAREEERRRLRRDLHDEIASTLAGMTLQLDGARNVLTSDPRTAKAILGKLTEETQACITEIRRMIDNLRPAALDQLGLIGALQAKAARFSGPVGTPEWSDGNLVVCVESHSLLPDLPAAVEVAAYRIAEEALMNTARHARARHCWIRLSANHALELEVIDDGDGLQPGREQGVGLASMKERAAELGGTCAITSTPGQGTRVLATIPLVEV